MNRAVDKQEVEATRRTRVETPGVSDVHATRTRMNPALHVYGVARRLQHA